MAAMSKPVFDVSQSALLLRHCLAAGKSSWFYQRETALLGSKLRAWHAADWINALLDTRALFARGPLLGESLTALASALQQEVETKSPTASKSTKREQSIVATPSSKPKAQRALEGKFATNPAAWEHEHSQRQEQSIAKPHTPSLVQKLPRVERQVNQALLSRLAGSSLKLVNSASPSRNLRQVITKLEEAEANSRKRHFLEFKRALPSPSAATSSEAGAASSLPLACCDRVSLRLRQSGGSVGPYAAASAEVAASLSQQWSTSLNGARATMALLRHLAGLASVTAESKNTSASSHSPRTSNHERLARTTSGKVEKRAARQTNAETAMLGNADLLNEMPEAPPRNKRAITAPEIRRLPPLNRPEALPPSPLPSKRESHALPEEMAAAGDDLEALAGKIKQILDDDARRHGIAVE